MKKWKSIFFGFIGFFLISTFNVSIAVLVYSSIDSKKDWQIALFLLFVILLNTILCIFIEQLRRKYATEKPLKEILQATKQMAHGNFNIQLTYRHNYDDFDEFDYIKSDLNHMAEELSKNEILKTDFIANLSHEFKTPLMVLSNYAKTLQNPALTKQQRDHYLDVLQQNCQKLNQLITNILRLNKLENQNLLPDITFFNLSHLLGSQILNFEDLIEKKQIDLQCDIQEDLCIHSEKSYLEIVFNNLMSNAIKFNRQEGKIFVSLKKIDDTFIIAFQDTGCGMDTNTGKHIFDKFYQGDTSHQKEGNGLGLALVKKVIDILGGKITVQSEKNIGTTFIITIKEVIL
mgnify:CR=1 FL=1